MARTRPKDNFPKPVEVIPSRTDEEKVAQASVTVVLGGVPYEVKPLVIRDSRAWRKELAEQFNGLAEFVNVRSDDTERYEAAIKAALVTRPDAVIDLFFSYAKDLPKEQIEAVATDSEVADAFSEVLKIALPLAGGLSQAMGKLSQSGRPSS